MKYTLLVYLQSGQVVAQVVRRTWTQRARHLLRHLPGGGSISASFGDVIACDTQPTTGDESDLAPALDRSIVNVCKDVAMPPEGWDLEVRLGLAFSRLGLLPLEGIGLSAPNLAAVAGLWIRERLHLDPASQALRWRMVGSGHLLVFCAPRSLLDLVGKIADLHNLRLKSFLPAALKEVSRRLRHRPKRGQPASRVLVWTEPEGQTRRAAPVHMFHLEGRQLRTDWRGWLPSPDTNTGPDASLQGALARFVEANGASEAAIEYAHWTLPGRIGALA